jgi:hypothetical protein
LQEARTTVAMKKAIDATRIGRLGREAIKFKVIFDGDLQGLLI